MDLARDTYADGLRQREADARGALVRRTAEAHALVPLLADCLVDRFGARRVWLWGSLAAGQFHVGSDIDLVAEGLDRETGLFRALAALADLAPGFRVDVVPLEDTEATTRASIAREAIFLREAHGA